MSGVPGYSLVRSGCLKQQGHTGPMVCKIRLAEYVGVTIPFPPALILSSALLCATPSSKERWHLYSGRIN